MWICGIAMALALWIGAPLAASDVKEEFAAKWTRPVTLKKPLYSIAYGKGGSSKAMAVRVSCSSSSEGPSRAR